VILLLNIAVMKNIAQMIKGDVGSRGQTTIKLLLLAAIIAGLLS
jgi:hypothetical protein